MRPVREATSKVQFNRKWSYRNWVRKLSMAKELKEVTRYQASRRWVRQA